MCQRWSIATDIKLAAALPTLSSTVANPRAGQTSRSRFQAGDFGKLRWKVFAVLSDYRDSFLGGQKARFFEKS